MSNCPDCAPGTMITDIDREKRKFLQLITLRARLRIEMQTGLKHSNSRTAYSLLKDLGYKGSREKVLAQLCADIANMTVQGVKLK